VKKAKIAFLILGLVLFGVLLYTFDFRQTLTHLLKVGWKFVFIVLIYLINHALLTVGWKVLIAHPLSWKHFPKLLAARIAGDASSSINTLAAATTEPVKAAYIRDLVPMKTGLASVVLDRTIHTIANVLIILFGIVIGFFKLDLPLYAMAATFGVFTAMLGILVHFVRKQKKGFLMYLSRSMPGYIRRRLLQGSREAKVRELDEEIAYIFSSRDNMRHFYISLFMHTVPVLITGILEIYMIMIFSGIDISLLDAMLVYIFGLFLTSVIFFMPANLGTSEGSYSLALILLHNGDPSWGALGVSIGFIRRLRTFVWAGIGMLLIVHAGITKKGAQNGKESINL